MRYGKAARQDADLSLRDSQVFPLEKSLSLASGTSACARVSADILQQFLSIPTKYNNTLGEPSMPWYSLQSCPSRCAPRPEMSPGVADMNLALPLLPDSS